MDKVEELRQKHIKKFRRFQWTSGGLGVFYASLLFIWPEPFLTVLSTLCGIMCLGEEYLIEKVKHWDTASIMEFERLTKKWHL